MLVSTERLALEISIDFYITCDWLRVFADNITVDPENNLVSLHFTLHFCLVSQLSHDFSQLLKLPIK
jgi:hypothetical protein